MQSQYATLKSIAPCHFFIGSQAVITQVFSGQTGGFWEFLQVNVKRWSTGGL